MLFVKWIVNGVEYAPGDQVVLAGDQTATAVLSVEEVAGSRHTGTIPMIRTVVTVSKSKNYSLSAPCTQGTAPSESDTGWIEDKS